MKAKRKLTKHSVKELEEQLAIATEAIAPCPNNECESKCDVGIGDCGWIWVFCPMCSYRGPAKNIHSAFDAREEAIRLHNAIASAYAARKSPQGESVPVEKLQRLVDNADENGCVTYQFVECIRRLIEDARRKPTGEK